MDALAVTGDVADLPVLRPVIGMDKEEIVRIARHIGTFETSILPYEDCCTVFTPRHPNTRPHVEEVREAEAGAGRGGPGPPGHGRPRGGKAPLTRFNPNEKEVIPCPTRRRSLPWARNYF